MEKTETLSFYFERQIENIKHMEKGHYNPYPLTNGSIILSDKQDLCKQVANESSQDEHDDIQIKCYSNLDCNVPLISTGKPLQCELLPIIEQIRPKQECNTNTSSSVSDNINKGNQLFEVTSIEYNHDINIDLEQNSETKS